MRLLCHLAILLAAFQLGSMMNGLDLDPSSNLDDDAFRAKYGLRKNIFQEDRAKRSRALKRHERIVNRENIQYAKGQKAWFDRINDFSDLTDDEVVKAKTGLKIKDGRGRGLILHQDIDEASERYFDKFRYSRASVPRSYSSVDKGNVSPVKSQKQCGSCTAFATMAAVETCYKKVSGVFGDYSEQELVDCGMYGAEGAYGCQGAYIYAYGKWIVKNKRKLTSESKYPYMGSNPTYKCPRENPLDQGVQVTDTYYTHGGDEETLKRLVYEHGTVIIALHAGSKFSYYGGGILTQCDRNDWSSVNHAVAVVGYGTEGRTDFWIVKNSWGSWWGANGFIRIKRGTNACGIGWWISTVSCARR